MTLRLPPNVLDGNLVLDFTWKFSVFECALKREGFLRRRRDNGAEPDWYRFGREMRGRFAQVSNPGFAEAVGKLQLLAPRRQVVCDGRLGWDAIVQRDDESEEMYVLRLPKAARNNLFHGGKYPDGPVEEVARDRDILRAALVILDGCYELHAGLPRWIDEAA